MFIFRLLKNTYVCKCNRYTFVRPALWIWGGKPCLFHFMSLPSKSKGKTMFIGCPQITTVQCRYVCTWNGTLTHKLQVLLLTSVDFFIREQKPTSKEWLPTKTHKKSSSILTQKLPYITPTVLEGFLPGKYLRQISIWVSSE